MWKISIEKERENINDWNFKVNIKNKEGEFNYSVSVSKDYYRDITSKKIPPVTLVERSFLFLLNKEKASDIKSSFNIKEINTYFAEFESSIERGLN